MEEHMSKKTDWGKVVRDTVNDVICAIKVLSYQVLQIQEHAFVYWF